MKQHRVEWCDISQFDDELEEHLVIGPGPIQAGVGEELIQKALAQRPALVLTDLEMPLVDGSEAIRQLRNDARTASVPMLLFSAREDGAPLARAVGADEFIAKPFANKDLLSRITAHLLKPQCASRAA